MADFDVLYDKPMLLGESPFWHEKESSLYWIDITDKMVHRHTLANDRHSSWPLPSEPGCIARCETGGLLVAMRSGLALLDTDSGALTHIANAPYDTSKMRFNDGRCDGMGRLWAGTLYEPKDQPLASLYCVERSDVRHVGNPVTVSNGVAFSIDQRTLYQADTTAHRITAYDFDLESGVVGHGRLFKQFSTDKSHDYGGRPDGAAVDSEDCYWCAMYEGGQLIRFSPKGEILQQIRLPVKCPTMLAFGGDDLCTVYVTSARHNRSEQELKDYPLSGHILSFRTDVPGMPEPAYMP
ncbi:SMP-30/gluconolactonase/LRE family protein [Noviherbaspirillum sp.]|uniref:SMP-30/gluconolactonase/LRE family protein n=1 Tax=Noviherbaspirillum sp. TaxID=1926288 RepID=UPI002FE06484